jgi:MFS family permease
MEKTRFLSDEEKLRGVKGLVRFQSFNGMGFNFLGDTTIYLLAIMYGASNVQLGYISSAVFLSGIFLPLIPRLFQGKNIVSVLAWSWTMRGLVCIGYAALFFLNDTAGVYLILSIYTAFAAIRTVGVVMFRPLMRMISTNTNQGTVVGRSDFAFQTSSIVSKTISFIVTAFEQFSGVIGILLLQLLGVITNTAAGLSLRRIPCRETVEYHKGQGVLVQFRTAARDRNLRRVLFLHWLSIAVLVLSNLAIPFVRNRLFFSTSVVFLFSMGITLATILAALFVRTFSDRIGSRPLIVISSLFTFGLTAVWVIIPETMGKFFYFIPGFLLMFTVSVSRMLVGKLIIRTMPDDDRIGFNAMVDFVTALVSLALGILGGKLIDFGPDNGGILLNGYSWTFLLAALLSLAIVIFALKVEEKESMGERDAAALLLSIDGLRAFMSISKLQRIEDPVRKQTVLLSIGSNRNNLATGEIRRMLLSPFSSEKAEMIRALFYYPRASLLPLLLEEAAEFDSYTQNEAIFALGSYRSKETETLLLSLLDSDSARVRASAAKSLGRIGHRESLAHITELAHEEQDIRNLMNYTISLHHMDEQGLYLENLFRPSIQRRRKRFRQSLYSLQADLLHLTPDLARLFQLGNVRRGAGLRDFLDETRDHPEFLGSHPELVAWFKADEDRRITQFCLGTAETAAAQGLSSSSQLSEAHRRGIRTAVISLCTAEVEKLEYDEMLALLYFTYQIVKP